VINGTKIESDLFEAALLSPAVHEKLLIDISTKQFAICDHDIDPTDFLSLQRLVCGENVVFCKTARTSLVLLSRRLGNIDLEKFFFGLWLLNSSSSSSTDAISMNIMDLMMTRSTTVSASTFYLHSMEDISLLTVDTLDDILSSDSLRLKSEDVLLKLLLELGSTHSQLLRHVRFEFLSNESISDLATTFSYVDLTESIWEGILVRLKGIYDSSIRSKRFVSQSSLPLRSAIPQLDSKIVSDFPSIFTEFCGKRFRLLYRGSDDGFGARDFHRRCDGRAPTLTMILDTGGFIFGGFTPLTWESWQGQYKRDDSTKSFIFTLKNPHNTPAKTFSMKQGQMGYSMYAYPEYGPTFGGGYDIYVCNNCNASSSSYTTYFGHTYNNDTGLNGTTFFTGSPNFTVREIEVFELTD
jgi:hypothetical protein